jgi:PAS domain S-box-containing protein
MFDPPLPGKRMTAQPQLLNASVLGQLLIMQSVLSSLPDETSIFSFVCRGLVDLPGVQAAGWATAAPPDESPNGVHLPLRVGGAYHGELLLTLSDRMAFEPYRQYLQNFAFIVAVILEERRQRRLNEEHQAELEQRVLERTRQLDNEIAERIRTEEALRRSERLFRAAFENATVGACMVGAEGYFLSVNDAFCKMLGFSRLELMNVHYNQITYHEDYAIGIDFMRRALAGQVTSSSFEKRYLHKDGRVIWAIVSSTLLSDDSGSAPYFITYIQDITERRWALEALRKSEAQFRLLAENSTDMISRHNPRGIYLYVSPACRTMLGYEPEELIGHSAFEFIHSDDLALIEQSRRQALQETDSRVVIYRLRRKDGAYVWVESTTRSNWDERSGVVSDIQVSSRDISERKRSEAALQEAQARILQNEKLAAIGKLVAGVAHELNNPLSSVVLFSQIVQKKVSDPEIRGDLEKIVAESMRAARIVRGLLDFARQRPTELKLAQVNDLLRDSLEMLAYELRTHNVRCELRLAPALPPALLDSHQIQQVFLNVITNAWQSLNAQGRPGSLEITSESGAARFQGRSGQAQAVIRIAFADDGPGIPGELLARIFDPFFTTRLEQDGAGLGLAICHGIIAEHGGHIWAENRPEGGARFVIELPAASSGDQAPAANPPQPEFAAPQNKAILVIDDEAGILEAIALALGEQGYRVATERDGQAALQRLQHETFDLILCDIRMPGLGGQEIYRRLEQRSPDLARRMLFITGDSVSPDTRAFLEQSGAAWMNKPFGLKQLLERVSELLKAA